MANYSTLKAAVANVVKTNGNRAITGANLQTVLLSIINSVGGGGYIFKGVATPSTSAGTPDENVFYIGGAGTYANFGISITVPVGSICVFKYNGSWAKEQIAFAGIDDVPTANSNNLVKSGGVYNLVSPIEQSLLGEVTNISYTNNYGVDSRSGGNSYNTDYKRTGYINVGGGAVIYVTLPKVANNSFVGLAYFDADKTYISGERFVGSPAGYELKRFVTPANAAFISCTAYKDTQTYGEFILLSGEKYVSKDTFNEVAENVEILGNSAADKPCTININEYDYEAATSTSAYFTFNIPYPIASQCSVTINQELRSVNSYNFFDKYGIEIGYSPYTATLSSFTIPANTAKIRLHLRNANYDNTSIITLQIVGSIGDVYDNDQVIPYYRIDANGTVFYNNVNRRILRFKVKPSSVYVLQTGYGLATAQSDIYIIHIANDGTTQTEQITEIKQYVKGMKGYIINTNNDDEYIVAMISNSTVAGEVGGYYYSVYSSINNRRENKPLSVWVLGDSLSATGYLETVFPFEKNGPIGGWISLFLQNVSVRPVKWYNYSVGGYSLSDISSDGVSDDSYLKELNNAISDYNNNLIDAPDIVMIVGCTNDINKSTDRFITDAEIQSSGYSSFDEYVERTFFTSAGDYNHLPLIPLANINKGKIIGALRYIIEKTGDLFSSCKWVIVTPPQNSRKGWANGQLCVRDMVYGALKLNVPVIDVWREGQMPMLWDYNADWTASTLSHRFLSDGIHTYYNPSTQSPIYGYERQGLYIAKRFSDIFAFDLAPIPQ